MINSSELRLNNWVLEEGKPRRIYSYSFSVSDNYDPIPLTPEILEKCGMPIHGPELYTGDRPITITELSIIQIAPDNTLELIVTMFRGDSYPKRGMPEPRIKYLHQLQNLHFSLFGTELEINLTEK